MKKLITFIIGVALAYSCSTSSDGNGNSTTTVVPVAPSNLTGIVFSPTQINLSWSDNSTNEVGFKIERKTGSGTFAVVGTTAANITTFNDIGLTPSTSYTYRIYSFNDVGNSLTYSNEKTLTTFNTIIGTSGIDITDIDGHIYHTVTNCSSTWTTSNLNVSRYRNGDIIPQVSDPTTCGSLTTGAWCYYNNDPANGAVYGKLYNWYAVNDPRGLAPQGYHIPNDSEWINLTNCLDSNATYTLSSSTPSTYSCYANNSGGKMKEIGFSHWLNPNTGATNMSGINALPSGIGSTSNGYILLNRVVYWWSSTQISLYNGQYWFINYNDSIILNSANGGGAFKAEFCSVRCVKD